MSQAFQFSKFGTSGRIWPPPLKNNRGENGCTHAIVIPAVDGSPFNQTVILGLILLGLRYLLLGSETR